SPARSSYPCSARHPRERGDPVRRGFPAYSPWALEYWGDSTGPRHTLCMAHSEEFVESFRRCFPAEGFSRPGVECKGHGLKVIGIVCAEIGALWKVLA